MSPRSSMRVLSCCVCALCLVSVYQCVFRRAKSQGAFTLSSGFPSCFSPPCPKAPAQYKTHGHVDFKPIDLNTVCIWTMQCETIAQVPARTGLSARSFWGFIGTGLQPQWMRQVRHRAPYYRVLRRARRWARTGRRKRGGRPMLARSLRAQTGLEPPVRVMSSWSWFL